MKNLEAVRAAIIKAVPEIVELKFGCEVETFAIPPDPEVRGQVGVITGQQLEEPFHLVVRFDRESCPFTQALSEDDLKILGRPIRLADVLVAIHSQAPANKTLITLESDGQFMRYDPVSGVHWTQPSWNLRADGLSPQSEQCIDFLHSLLCV